MELYELTMEEARARLDGGGISAEELTRAYLDRIEAVDPKVKAYITVTADSALADAAAADRAIAAREAGPLTGIPVSVKDVLCTKGLRTTCASRVLENFVPPYDACVVEKLRAAGAVILGKVNMDEFAMGSSCENSAFFPTRNPWDLSRIPGGSSGGSAAAAAAGLSLGSVGTDTGGSIRQPASHCGVVGIKPTYGRVSRYGLVAFASSLDQAGPLGRTVGDCARLLNVLAGYDPRDSTSVDRPVPDYTAALSGGVKGLRIGLPAEYAETEGLDPEVRDAVESAVRTLESLGAETAPVSLPHTKYAVAAYYLIAPSEAGSNLARYDGVRYGFRAPEAENLIDMYRKTRSAGFGAEVQRRIIIGTYALSAGYYDAYYVKASQVRTRIMEDFRTAFESCDVIASPVTPTPAFPVGEKTDDPLTMYLSDIFTLSANLAGVPGISVPCGFSGDGLPIGLQLMGPHFGEERLIAAGKALENELELFRKWPSLG
ncbi:MAG: Asp-tRNA(Asn)/Glu-tRNA(Gln) amidotransferase subunit GatA [Desulfococcaceae bacterium]